MALAVASKAPSEVARPVLLTGARRPPWVRPVLAVIALIAAFFAGASTYLSKPDAKPASAPADEVSAARAMAHVRVIAGEPHPTGSPAMAAVADYLAAQLSDIGFEVSRQDADGLHNVVGRLQGTDPTGAVLFVTHPDSVAVGPGAGDNATGVAAVLEAMRALQAGRALPNDIVVLFDDGEEQGFRGGYLFAEQHPWMAGVKLFVGLDTAAWGPPRVSQVSNDDAVIVRGYADGVSSPRAYGLASAADQSGEYETFPFRQRGLPAIEIEDAYANADQHTSADTPDNVDPVRVQQMGDQVLDLARSYGAMDLTNVSQGSRMYHTLPFVGVVHYPTTWTGPLLILLVLGFAAVMVLASNRKRVALASAAGLGLIVGVAVVGLGLAALYEAWKPNPNPLLEEYLLPSSAPFYAAAALLLVALFGLGYWRLGRRIGWTELALGFVGLVVVCGLAVSAGFGAGGYVLVVPGLLAVAVWLVALRRGGLAWPVFLVPGIVGMFITAPMTLDGFFTPGVANLPLQAFLGSFLLGLIAPALAPMRTRAVRPPLRAVPAEG